MPILSTDVKITHRVGSRARARIIYTLDDTREIVCNSIMCDDLAHAQQISIDMADKQLANQARHDALEAIRLDILTANKTATLRRVQFEYLHTGLEATDLSQAYHRLARVMPDLIASGLTIEQIADRFNTRPRVIKRIIDKWNKIKDHGTTLQAYKALKDSL